MAKAEADVLDSGDDLVRLSDGGGPFQDMDDVPGKTSKQMGTYNPVGDGKKKRAFNGGAVKESLAGK